VQRRRVHRGAKVVLGRTRQRPQHVTHGIQSLKLIQDGSKRNEDDTRQIRHASSKVNVLDDAPVER
jgi:hypothetical protein